MISNINFITLLHYLSERQYHYMMLLILLHILNNVIKLITSNLILLTQSTYNYIIHNNPLTQTKIISRYILSVFRCK